jgi:CBS domain-containing membrane protein
MTKINEIMNTQLYTLTPEDNLKDAVTLMNDKRIRHIPVIDEGDVLKGLVTQRDVLLYMHKNESEQEQIKLEDMMTKNVVSVDENASIRKAALFLQKHKLGCLPVVEGKKLIGIITDSDIVAVAINLLEQVELTEPLENE